MNGRFIFNCAFTAAAIWWITYTALSTDFSESGFSPLHRAREIVAQKSSPQFWHNMVTVSQTGVKKAEKVTLAKIQSSVKVLCFVETCDKYLYTRAIVINNTWASRCDKTLFISDVENKSFPAISPPGVETGYRALWSKTMYSFRYLYKHYVNDYHWFMKADDDTYVVVENLKLFLAKHNPGEPHYFGKYFKVLGGYTSGGAGYAISRESLKKLEDVMANEKSPRCRTRDINGNEDVNIGLCLAVAKIRPGHTLDKDGRDLFHSFNANGEIMGDNYPGWYYQYSNNTPIMGCSNETITFHYMDPKAMKVTDFLMYQLSAFRNTADELYPINPYYLN